MMQSGTKTCRLKNDQQDEEFKIDRIITSSEADGKKIHDVLRYSP